MPRVRLYEELLEGGGREVQFQSQGCALDQKYEDQLETALALAQNALAQGISLLTRPGPVDLEALRVELATGLKAVPTGGGGLTAALLGRVQAERQVLAMWHVIAQHVGDQAWSNSSSMSIQENEIRQQAQEEMRQKILAELASWAPATIQIGDGPVIGVDDLDEVIKHMAGIEVGTQIAIRQGGKIGH